MIVNGVAYARLSSISLPAPGSPSCGRVIGQSPGWTARIVKYIANRPAKNISSLESQTMVPTLTMFGRVSECTLLDSNVGAAAVEVTDALCPARADHSRRGRGVFRFGIDRRAMVVTTRIRSVS